MLLNQSATREATHLPELTAVNSTHKLVVHECILRRLDIAEARFHTGVSTKIRLARDTVNPDRLRKRAYRPAANPRPYRIKFIVVLILKS